MRNLFFGTLVLIALFIGAFYYVFYTPALILKELPVVVEKYFKDATLSSLNIGGQSFEYPETLKLSKISAEVEWKNDTYQIEAEEFDILNFQTFLKDKKQVVLRTTGLTVQRKNFGLKKGAVDATVNLNAESITGYIGSLRNGELNLNPYQLSGTQAKFEGNKDNFKISEINAQAYGGQVKGDIRVELKPRRTETLALEFGGFKSQELQTLNKPIFSQLFGEFKGTLRLTRIDDQIQVLAILAEMSKGGTMEKALSKKIVSYMTDEENRYAVENVIENQGKINFDNGEFRILNVSQNLAAVTVTLENKKEKLRIHETINIDISRILQKIAWKN